MLVPLSWLKDYVDIDVQPKELEEKLNAESIDITLPGYNVKSGSKHPMNIVVDEIIDICKNVSSNSIKEVASKIEKKFSVILKEDK